MKSPGHRDHPEHRVREESFNGRITLRLGGQVLAESDDVIKVVEDDLPARYYFPRSAVQMSLLSLTETTRECPYKGHATYFDVQASGLQLDDAAWSYQAPYEEHQSLAGRIAFHVDKYLAFQVNMSRP